MVDENVGCVAAVTVPVPGTSEETGAMMLLLLPADPADPDPDPETAGWKYWDPAGDDEDETGPKMSLWSN